MRDAEADFVAECFWPDVTETDLIELDREIARAAAELPAEPGFRYLGSILLREDEVVLCQFQGRPKTVHEVAERARIPFERILAADRSPWRPSSASAPTVELPETA
jgi:hypothetical protein